MSFLKIFKDFTIFLKFPCANDRYSRVAILYRDVQSIFFAYWSEIPTCTFGKLEYIHNHLIYSISSFDGSYNYLKHL